VAVGRSTSAAASRTINRTKARLGRPSRRHSPPKFYEWSDRLDEESKAVIDLIEAGKLDEAEKAAHQLIADYPEVHDGYDRLGMVYEARKEPKKAADCYRKVVEFLAENPSDDEREMIDDFQRLVQELDPPTSPDPPP